MIEKENVLLTFLFFLRSLAQYTTISDHDARKETKILVKPWKYNIKSNINSGLSIVTMRRVATTFFELGVVKKFMKKF